MVTKHASQVEAVYGGLGQSNGCCGGCEVKRKVFLEDIKVSLGSW